MCVNLTDRLERWWKLEIVLIWFLMTVYLERKRMSYVHDFEHSLSLHYPFSEMVFLTSHIFCPSKDESMLDKLTSQFVYSIKVSHKSIPCSPHENCTGLVMWTLLGLLKSRRCAFLWQLITIEISSGKTYNLKYLLCNEQNYLNTHVFPFRNLLYLEHWRILHTSFGLWWRKVIILFICFLLLCDFIL